eukprot:scaffold61893_cov51-Phaeocystis_antarctica.AAC.5
MSAPGCITVSHATAEMLGADYETIYRGEHAVKGKVPLTLTLAPALTLALTNPGPNQGNLPLYYLVGRTNETLREARVYTPAETPPALCASTAGVPAAPANGAERRTTGSTVLPAAVASAPRNGSPPRPLRPPAATGLLSGLLGGARPPPVVPTELSPVGSPASQRLGPPVRSPVGSPAAAQRRLSLGSPMAQRNLSLGSPMPPPRTASSRTCDSAALLRMLSGASLSGVGRTSHARTRARAHARTDAHALCSMHCVSQWQVQELSEGSGSSPFSARPPLNPPTRGPVPLSAISAGAPAAAGQPGQGNASPFAIELRWLLSSEQRRESERSRSSGESSPEPGRRPSRRMSA